MNGFGDRANDESERGSRRQKEASVVALECRLGVSQPLLGHVGCQRLRNLGIQRLLVVDNASNSRKKARRLEDRISKKL